MYLSDEYKKKLFIIETKLAWVRAAAVCLCFFLVLYYSPGLERKILLSLLSFSGVYSLGIIPVIKRFQRDITLMSKILTVIDALIISVGLCFTGVSGYFTQLYFLSVVGAALRFSMTFTMVLSIAEIAAIIFAEYMHRILVNESITFMHLIIGHVHWFAYILLVAFVSGLIAKEVSEERSGKEEKQRELDSSKVLVDKFNLFTKKINQASYILFFRDAKIEDFINTIARETAVLTGSKSVQFTVFDKDNKIEYIARQPNPYSEEPLNIAGNSESFKSISLFIINNYPYGVIFNNFKNQALFKDAKYISKLGKHMVCATSSLKNGKKIIIFAINDEREFSQTDLSMIQSFSLHIGFALENKERNELFIEKSVIENEMKVTAEIQKSLSPKQALEVNGLKIKCYYTPSMFVSGDYVDYFVNESGKYITVISDIMGGGLSRGFLSLGIRSALRIISSEETDSAIILSRLNKHICENYSELNGFVTMYMAVYDFDKNMMNAAIAGHYSPMAWDGKDFVQLNFSSGLALGIDQETQYESTNYMLKSNALVISYTDGIIEARNKYGELFGKERLRRSVEEYLENCREIEIDDIAVKIKSDLINFTDSVGWSDDWSLLISYRR